MIGEEVIGEEDGETEDEDEVETELSDGFGVTDDEISSFAQDVKARQQRTNSPSFGFFIKCPPNK